jgi:hypothetical protein
MIKRVVSNTLPFGFVFLMQPDAAAYKNETYVTKEILHNWKLHHA